MSKSEWTISSNNLLSKWLELHKPHIAKNVWILTLVCSSGLCGAFIPCILGCKVAQDNGDSCCLPFLPGAMIALRTSIRDKYRINVGHAKIFSVLIIVFFLCWCGIEILAEIYHFTTLITLVLKNSTAVSAFCLLGLCLWWLGDYDLLSFLWTLSDGSRTEGERLIWRKWRELPI